MVAKEEQALAFAIATTLPAPGSVGRGQAVSYQTSLHPSSQFILTSLRAKLLLL